MGTEDASQGTSGSLRPGEAPPGLRIYAIGDIHGCIDHLETMLTRIDADVAARPVATHRLVFVGDYIDRGPDTKGVIDRLLAVREARPDTVFLRGNHEAMFLDFLDAPDAGGNATVFLSNGGAETLRSYDCNLARIGSILALSGEALEMIPPAHIAFLRATTFSLRLGGYFFCHAGVRPGVDLDDQSAEDLVWIRERFLRSDKDFGAVVVHGHTPTTAPVVKANRIGIDTGAVYGGPLTAVALEGTGHRFIAVD